MATETLRPNGAGDIANISWQVPASGAHWEKVDEVTPDEDETYVYSTSFAWEDDLYALPASGVGEGEITSVEVFIRCRIGVGEGYDARTTLKTHDTVYYSDVFLVPTSWTNYSKEYTVNPYTEEAWTWAEIDALQIGVGLFAGPAMCTQVWVVVTYTPSIPKTSSDTGSGVEAKASGNPLATYSRSESGLGAETMPGRGFAMPDTGQGIDTQVEIAPLSEGETGSGVDAVLNFLASLTKADSGVGADTILNYLASLVKSDSGTGVEHILDRALVLVQAGSGVELSSLLKAMLVTETGSGVESSYKVVLAGIKTSSDTGGGADASALTAILAPLSWVSPTGHNDPDEAWADETNAYDGNTDTHAEGSNEPLEWSSFLELTVSAITCSAIRFYAPTPGQSSESQIDIDVYYESAWHDVYEGALVLGAWNEKSLGVTKSVTGMRLRYYNSSSMLAGTPRAFEFAFGEPTDVAGEVGSGAEQVTGRALHLKEYPTGAIDLAKVLTAAITGTGETGSGAEQSIKEYYYKQADSGVGSEASSLLSVLASEDVGTGAEAITLLASFLASDSGQSVDKVLTYLRQLIDSGQGAEVVNLMGIVGRVMHLLTYLRGYCNLTVYTSEVKE